MADMKKKTMVLCVLLAASGLALYGQEVVAKAVESIGQQLLVRNYEKAYSYAAFVVRFYKNAEMPTDAVDACERAVEAYAGQLAADRKWQELVALDGSLAAAPKSVREKAAAPLADAKKAIAAEEAERKRKAEEQQRAEQERARLAEIEANIRLEQQAEAAREAARKKEREEAAARELALMTERTKAEEAQRTQIDRLIQESRNLELQKEQLREAERKASLERQAELEKVRIKAEDDFRQELSRVIESTARSNNDTIKMVSNANYALVAGLGILALFVIVGVTLLVVVSLRQQKLQHEQFQSTLHVMQAMRNVGSGGGSLALPYAPMEVEAPRALAAGNAPLMLEAGAGAEQEAPQSPAKELLERCRSYGLEIDKATGRRNASRLVADLVYKVSRQLGYSEQDAVLYFAVGLVYDIGFLNIDPAILRAEQISEDQFAVIKTHATVGLNMVFFVDERFRGLFKDGVSKHHENLDGSGYPYGLKDGDIPYIARALRVVESYVALISSREYRRIQDRDTAMRDLYGKPEYYDQDIVKALDAVV